LSDTILKGIKTSFNFKDMIKHKRNIRRTAVLALVISLLGFFVDSDPREESIFVNIFEIGLMSTLIFVLFSLVYFLVSFISRLLGINDMVGDSE
jgi:diacylglycerol kinase